jgi:membrane-associated phospholipid phosphatase
MAQRESSPSSDTASDGGPRQRDTETHTRTDLIVIAVGALVLVGCALLARNELTDVEVSIFQAVNELPQGYHAYVWPLMQYGTFITIPILAVLAFAFRRFRLGWAMLLAGTSVYLLALVVKQAVERGRPGWLLRGVEERERFGAESLGFPSGHAAVAAALTVVVAVHLSKRWAIAAIVLASAVIFGRMYVGAHLPLDLVGGAALGAIAGGVANLLIPPRPRQQPEGASEHHSEP